MRIAYFSPLNPVRSGISDYSEELLPHLAKHAELELFVNGYTPDNPLIADSFRVHDYRDFEDMRRRFDIVLYQMGNSIVHDYIYRTLWRYPGVTVLHEYVLHHYLVEATVAKGDKAAYLREMAFCHGTAGLIAAREAIWGDGGFPYTRFPANRRVIAASHGIIVHSQYVASQIHADAASTPVAVIMHHATPFGGSGNVGAIREALGLPVDSTVFASFGLVTPEKHIDIALRAFLQVRSRLPAAKYLIVGHLPAEDSLLGLIDTLGLEESVILTGYVTKDRMQQYLLACDVCVSLRWPTMGETSGIVLRSLAAGTPVIVSDTGAFSELPDDCSRKLPVGDTVERDLAASMLELAEDADLRVRMGALAQQYVKEHHAVEQVAAEYIAFLEKVRP